MRASGARALSVCVQREGQTDGGQTAAAAQSAQASEAQVKGHGACGLAEPHSVALLSHNKRELTLNEWIDGPFRSTLVTSAACTAGGGRTEEEAHFQGSVTKVVTTLEKPT